MGDKIIINDNNPSFCLRLADGRRWQLVSSTGSAGWLRRLAWMMRLKDADARPENSSVLVFLSGSPLSKQQLVPPAEAWSLAGSLLPRKGWRSRKAGPVRLWTHLDVPHLICELLGCGNRELEIVQMWMAMDPIYNGAVRAGGLPVHAAMLEKEGSAVILAAGGGVGKSTCCKRAELPWQCRCDDEVLLVKSREGRFLGHPFPTWSDHLWGDSTKTWDVQQAFPVRAIFFLRRGGTDHVEALSRARAALLLSKSSQEVVFRSAGGLGPEETRRLRLKLFDSACSFAMSVPAFSLSVTLGEDFAAVLDGTLSEA